MPCMCGDLYCGSCGPAQGNHRCGNCGEWMADHEEHVAEALANQADPVIRFLRSLAAGASPLDYQTLRTMARKLLEEIKPEGCEHDDAKCSEAMRLQAEADYQWELEMEKSEAEYERWLAENPRV